MSVYIPRLFALLPIDIIYSVFRLLCFVLIQMNLNLVCNFGNFYVADVVIF